jgi:hypothetical protein
MIGCRPFESFCPADKAAISDVGQKRSQPVMHRLVTVTKIIEYVANCGYVKRFPDKVK